MTRLMNEEIDRIEDEDYEWRIVTGLSRVISGDEEVEKVTQVSVDQKCKGKTRVSQGWFFV